KASRIPELIREVAAKLEPLAHHSPARQCFILGLLGPLRAERLATFFAFNSRQDAVLLRLSKCRLAMRTFKLDRHLYVLGISRQVPDSEPQRIGPKLLDHIQRINAVALRLRHRLAVAIEDLRRNVHFVEWDLIHVV